MEIIGIFQGQYFEYTAKDGSESFAILIDSLLADPEYKALEVVAVVCLEDLARHIFENNGVEGPKLAALQDKIINNKDYKPAPIAVLDQENGYHTIADGNHRYVLATMMGCYEVGGRIVPRRIWEKHCFKHYKKAADEQQTNQKNVDTGNSGEAKENIGG